MPPASLTFAARILWAGKGIRAANVSERAAPHSTNVASGNNLQALAHALILAPAAATSANALAQKENLDPGRFRQARLHPLPNPLP